MTVVLSCACVLSLLFTALADDVSSVAAARARAQLAADAAALAAVAETGPIGTGDHEALARRYAEANGARLAGCLCGPSATAVQVRVVVDDVAAEARAVFDFEALRPAAVAAPLEGLDPRLRAAVTRLVAAARGEVRIVSGFRSRDQQQRLWSGAVTRYGSSARAARWVARPGTSIHEQGRAVDLGGDLGLAQRLVAELGLPLHRPLPHEPWHFELVGSR